MFRHKDVVLGRRVPVNLKAPLLDIGWGAGIQKKLYKL